MNGVPLWGYPYSTYVSVLYPLRGYFTIIYIRMKRKNKKKIKQKKKKKENEFGAYFWLGNNKIAPNINISGLFINKMAYLYLKMMDNTPYF